MSGPIRQQLADVASVTPTLNDKAVTIQANTVRTSTYTAIYNLFKAGFDAAYLALTGGTMDGNIDMDNNLIKRLGAPTENEDAANKLYADTVASNAEINANNYADTTKQPLFDYSGTGIGTNAVTINNFKGGTATCTRIIPAKDYRTFRINSNQIFSTSKIIPVLVYSGAGFPVILSQTVATNRVDFVIANLDVDGSGGLDTDASLFIEYQIVS